MISDESFPKSFRLTSRRDFISVQSKGQKVYGRYCTLLGLESTNTHPRVGITITKKVHKRAVKRNRFKRTVREIFRQSLRDEPVGIDVVAIARPDAVDCDYESLRKDLLRSWGRLIAQIQKKPKTAKVDRHSSFD